MVEVHPHPEVALSDGAQSLTLDGFRALIQQLRPVAEAVGRQLA
jgi:3-deoxy-7-phosphoheptulonate synthase